MASNYGVDVAHRHLADLCSVGEECSLDLGQIVDCEIHVHDLAVMQRTVAWRRVERMYCETGENQPSGTSCSEPLFSCFSLIT